MPDREKVIRAFEQYVYNFVELTTTDEYNHQILEQVLALLKEQQQYIWELQDQVEYLTDKLKEQGTELCDRCGRVRLKSKWEGR